MNVQYIPLEIRPQGRGVIAPDSDLDFMHGFTKGWVVTLRHEEVRIQAQVLDVDSDQSYLGQVVDIEGWMDPMADGLRIGAYLRFREENIFSCRR